MTKISIASAVPSSDLEIASFLHQRFKMSLMGSQRKLSMGGKGFFFTCELYGNDHIRREQDVLDIINFFRTKSIPLLILEIDNEKEWGALDLDNLDQYSVSETELLSALNSKP